MTLPKFMVIGLQIVKLQRGEAGVVDRVGSNSERCLKWGGGALGSLRNLN